PYLSIVPHEPCSVPLPVGLCYWLIAIHYSWMVLSVNGFRNSKPPKKRINRPPSGHPPPWFKIMETHLTFCRQIQRARTGKYEPAREEGSGRRGGPPCFKVYAAAGD